MAQFSDMQRISAVNVIASSIKRCEQMQPKFMEGTSQHSLLRNRIKALQIAQALIEEEPIRFTKEELTQALPPIVSIHHKCTKAQSKYEEGTTQFRRFQGNIDAMIVASAYINEALENLSLS